MNYKTKIKTEHSRSLTDKLREVLPLGKGPFSAQSLLLHKSYLKNHTPTVLFCLVRELEVRTLWICTAFPSKRDGEEVTERNHRTKIIQAEDRAGPACNLRRYKS